MTTNQPQEYYGTVYMFGHSFIFGIGSEDKHTISSHLQRELNEYYGNLNIISKLVINCANFSGVDYPFMFQLMDTITFQENDIIVIPVDYRFSSDIALKYGFYICSTQTAFDRPHEMGEVFVDGGHLNSEGNKTIAICEYVALN